MTGRFKMVHSIGYWYSILFIKLLHNNGKFETVLEFIGKFLIDNKSVILRFIYVLLILLSKDTN